VAAMAVILAIAIDLGNGYPGEGVFVVAYLGPVTIMSLSVLHVITTYITYTAMCATYLVWAAAFGASLGYTDMMTPAGANLAALFVSLMVFIFPWYAVAFLFLDARAALSYSVRKRVENCMSAVEEVQKNHDLVAKTARLQMPPFALRLLHSGASAVELEDTTALVAFRVHVEVQSEDEEDRDQDRRRSGKGVGGHSRGRGTSKGGVGRGSTHGGIGDDYVQFKAPQGNTSDAGDRTSSDGSRSSRGSSRSRGRGRGGSRGSSRSRSQSRRRGQKQSDGNGGTRRGISG